MPLEDVPEIAKDADELTLEQNEIAQTLMRLEKVDRRLLITELKTMHVKHVNKRKAEGEVKE